MIAASVRSRKRFKVEDFLLKFRSAEEIEKVISDAGKDLTPPPDWQRMKFIARLCAAEANANEARDAERTRRRAMKKAEREAAKVRAALTAPRARATTKTQKKG